MMKLRYILLCGALMLCLASCGSEPGNTANDVTNDNGGNNMMDDAGNAMEDVGDGIVDGVEDVGNGIKDGMDEMTGNGNGNGHGNGNSSTSNSAGSNSTGASK